MTELKTLKEYTEDAKRIIIYKLGNNINYMTDENIGAIIHQLVYADQHYNPEKGSLNNFRYNSAMFAIKRIMAKKKLKPISLSHKIKTSSEEDYGSSSSVELIEVLEDKKQILSLDEEKIDINEIVNHKSLTELEKFYLTEYYINGKKQIQIAKERGVTNRAVSFTIIAAIRKLKEVLDVKNQ